MANSGAPLTPSGVKPQLGTTAVPVLLIWACSFFSLGAISKALAFEDNFKRGYDTGTTVFSPRGRILQAEYASEAVMKSFPTLGIQCKDGIVLCGLRRRVHQILQRPPPGTEPESTFREKVCAYLTHNRTETKITLVLCSAKKENVYQGIHGAILLLSVCTFLCALIIPLKVWIADTAIAVGAAGLSSDAAAIVRMGWCYILNSKCMHHNNDSPS